MPTDNEKIHQDLDIPVIGDVINEVAINHEV